MAKNPQLPVLVDRAASSGDQHETYMDALYLVHQHRLDLETAVAMLVDLLRGRELPEDGPRHPSRGTVFVHI